MEHTLLEKHILELEERLMTYDYNELDQLLANDFLEFGTSGNIYTKEIELAAVRNRTSPTTTIKFTVTEFKIKELAPDLVLATYRTLRHNDMVQSLRSSIWRFNEGQWQIVFHQGTLTNKE